MRTELLGDGVFVVFTWLVLGLFTLMVLYPLVYIIAASISDPVLVNSGRMWLLPKGITMEGYRRVFQSSDILLGYRNTVLYTVAGVSINLFVTMTGAYALSQKKLVGRNVLFVLFTATMFFNGGLIPNFLLVKSLGLYDTVWAMLLPGAASMFNIIIARTYITANVPDEFLEAAYIDGCSDLRMFRSIVVPLCLPIISVLALFYGSVHWNSYFSALIYLKSRDLMSLQIFLREILVQAQISTEMLSTSGDIDAMMEQARAADLVRYTAIVVSSLPMIAVYPFLQRYFAQGMMLGGLKG